MEGEMFMREAKKRRLLNSLTPKQRKVIKSFPENIQVKILSQFNDGYSISACDSRGVSMVRNSDHQTISVAQIS